MEVIDIQDIARPRNKDIVTQSSCVNCANKEICKYVPEYTSFMNSLNDIYIPEFAKLATGCSYWVSADKKKKTPIG